MNTHTHHPEGPHDHGFSFLTGIVINSAFVLAEVIYGLEANSLALLADAGHNLSDVLGLAMAWGATWLARKPPSPRFTYGLRSASILAALANGLLLMVAVGGIGWEAVQRLISPELPAAGMIMAVAGAGVLVNGASAWLFHGPHHDDLNMRAAFLHMAGDAAISLGVVISAALIAETGWLWLDPLTSLGIIAVIIYGTWHLLGEAVTLALHAVPGSVETQQVKNYLAGIPGVGEVHDLHIWAMSTTEIALSAHLLMRGGHPGDAFIRKIGEALQERFHIGHATLQIELGDGDHCHAGCEHS